MTWVVHLKICPHLVLIAMVVEVVALGKEPQVPSKVAAVEGI
jgi:hypothetical protein